MIRLFAQWALIMCLLFALAIFAAKTFGRNLHHSILAFQAMPLQGREGESVYIYLVDEGRRINLTRHAAWDQGIAWSWDGEQLAFSADSCNGICVHNIVANETLSIHDLGAPARNQNPIWRPDGDLTYTVIDRNGTVYISTISLETDTIRQELTRAAESPPFILTAWSADGRYLAAYSDDIFVLDSQTGELLNITNTRSDVEVFPAWSPNGLLAFVSQRDNWVHVIDITSGENLPLDYLERGDRSIYSEDDPTWLPDGRLAITIFDRDTSTGQLIGDIRIVDLNTHTVENATENFDDYVYNPGWSADGRWMTFEVRTADIYIRNVYMRDMLTGAIMRITNSDDDELNSIWSP